MKRKIFYVLMALVLILSTVSVAFAQGGGNTSDTKVPYGQSKKAGNSVYIVQMSDAPVVAYEGGIAGYPATKPGQRQKIDPNDPKVIKYVGYLNSKHNAALNGVGGGQKLYGYFYSFNGFAAQLTADQAAAMKSQPGVPGLARRAPKHEYILSPEFPRVS